VRFLPGAAIGAAALVVALGAQGSVSRGFPRNFLPSSLAAVSAQDVWLLGVYRCGSAWCNVLLRSEDGGHSFVRVRSPPLPVQGAVPELRFADRRNGYVFVDKLFYATHDGGTSWRRIQLGDVLSVATGAGNAFVTSSRGLETSAVSADRWRVHRFGFGVFDVVALGQNVWVLGTDKLHEKLARSNDGGGAFTTGGGPCSPDLGGRLAPASARVVWAVCPTGMLAGVWKSADGGRSFTRSSPPRCCVNSALIVAPSEKTAVLAPAPGRGLLRTSDGGATWRPAITPSGRIDLLVSVSFGDARVGYVLLQLSGNTQALWKTTDAGATWRAVLIR
jgi:photosystem II stability/assembly factor-like uncharacterized protein